MIYVVLDDHARTYGSRPGYHSAYLLCSETTPEVYWTNIDEQTTAIMEIFTNIGRCVAPEDELANRFVKLNQQRFMHRESAALPSAYEFGEAVLPDADRHYPRELVGVSRVAFSSDGQAALVYAEYATGISGRGDYFLLRREDGKWKISCQASHWTGG